MTFDNFVTGEEERARGEDFSSFDSVWQTDIFLAAGWRNFAASSNLSPDETREERGLRSVGSVREGGDPRREGRGISLCHSL